MTTETKRFLSRTPRMVQPGRIVVHNYVRPEGFPNVSLGFQGFRAWTDVPKPKKYRVCRCGWAPHLRRHFLVKALDRVPMSSLLGGGA